MPTLCEHNRPTGYKRQVAERFDRAATTYDSYGDFQQLVLDRLITTLPFCQNGNVLDLGTGTGRALPVLASCLSPRHLIAADLASQMLAQARLSLQQSILLTDEKRGRSQGHLICADAESLPFCDHAFDLVFSSLALQWCLRPGDLFNGLYRVLNSEGYLVFSTLCQGSMPEVSKAWQDVGEKAPINRYASAALLHQQVVDSGFEVVSLAHEAMTMWFDAPEKAMHSINKVGAGLVSDSRSPISPSRWKAFLRQYEQQRTASGIPLSYQVAFVVAQKPVLGIE